MANNVVIDLSSLNQGSEIPFGKSLVPFVMDTDNLASLIAVDGYDNPSGRTIAFRYEDAENNHYTTIYKGVIGTPFFLKQINEGFDNAQISFKSTTLLKKLPSGTKCLVNWNCKISNADNLDEYMEYVISNGTISQSIDGVVYHTYNLVEPTYILTKFISSGGTDTNITSIDISEFNENHVKTTKTYRANANNLNTIVRRVLNIAELVTTANTDTIGTRISIDDDTQKLLKASCVGLSDTFPTGTIYDKLVKLFKYINRLPKLSFDRQFNGTTHKVEFKLSLKRFDGVDKSEITMDAFLDNVKGCTYSQSEGKDRGTMVCECQNLVGSQWLWYPSEHSYFLQTPTDDTLVLSYNNLCNYVLNLPVKIYSVDEVDMVVYHQTSSNYENAELVKFSGAEILKYQDWVQLDANSRKFHPYYKEGESIIYVGHLTQIVDSPTNADYYAYRVKYKPLISAMIKINGSNSFEQQINQLESSVDSVQFGTYLEEYAKSNQGSDLTVSKSYTDFNDVLDVGTRIDNGDDEFIINFVKVEINNANFNVNYSASKNVVKRSEVVNQEGFSDNKIVDTSKAQMRMNQISEKPIFARLSLPSETNSQDYSWYPRYARNLLSLFNNIKINEAGNNLTNPPKTDLCYARVRSTLLDGVSIDKLEVFNVYKFVAGKTMNFNIQGYDNRKAVIGGGVWNNSNTTNYTSEGEFKNAKWFNYADPFGKINLLDMMITKDQEIDTAVDESLSAGDETVQFGRKIRNFIQKYPFYMDKTDAAYSNTISTITISSPIVVNSINLKKDSNEILNVTIQLPFKAYDKKHVVNNELIQLMNGDKLGDLDAFGNIKLYIVVCDNAVGEGDIIIEPWCVRQVAKSTCTSKITYEDNSDGILCTNYLMRYETYSTETPQDFDKFYVTGNKTIALCVKDVNNTDSYNVLIARRLEADYPTSGWMTELDLSFVTKD